MLTLMVMLKNISLVLALILISGFFYIVPNYFGAELDRLNNYAATFFSTGIEVKDLVKKYADPRSEKIKILIVPGHEPSFGGTEYKNLKERDLNLALAEKIKTILAQNPKFEIITTRDDQGWNPEIKNYVETNKKEIESWMVNSKAEMSRLIKNGQITKLKGQIGRTKANSNSILFLYGINKWAAENKVDIAINLHFNNNPQYKGRPIYNGFSIYVPEKQYSNALSSKILAQDLLTEISKIQSTSTMPLEKEGIIEDQELIALGSFNTADSLSVLIEYAYIYEDPLQSAPGRDLFINQAAASTAKALNNFFESRKLVTR